MLASWSRHRRLPFLYKLKINKVKFNNYKLSDWIELCIKYIKVIKKMVSTHSQHHINNFFDFSPRKSKTWRSSLRSWEESKRIYPVLRRSQSRRTRRTESQSSSSELPSTSSHWRLMTRTRLTRSCNLFHQVNYFYWFYHPSFTVDLKRE